MKNMFYDIDDLFQVVRRYYVESFPYSAQPNGISVMNNELNRVKSSAKIRYVDDLKTSFENLTPAVRPESDFSHNPAVYLEEYLEQEQGRKVLLEDIQALQKWLVKAGYLYADGRNHMATEALLRTYKLTK